MPSLAGRGFAAFAYLFPLVLMTFYLIASPYTKVEESFNMQATHDFLYQHDDVKLTTILQERDRQQAASGKRVSGCPFANMGRLVPSSASIFESFFGVFNEEGQLMKSSGGLGSFDHHQFPGVVPRTCLGALAVSSIASPLINAWRLMEFERHFPSTIAPYFSAQTLSPFIHPQLFAQVISRWVLGVAVWVSIVYLARGFHDNSGQQQQQQQRPRQAKSKSKANNSASNGGKFDYSGFADPGAWLCLLVGCTQFHINYYATRMLPNTFALILVNLSYGLIMRHRYYAALVALSFCTVVFRSDTAVLAFPIVCWLWLFSKKISFFRGLVVGVSSMLLAILATSPVDSAFWSFPLWPEGYVLYYNTYLNKSSNWGRMPFHWYWSSALPRGLLATLPLLLFALFKAQKYRKWILPQLAFIALYSFLPHKELRFVMIAFPSMAIAPALTCAHLFMTANGSSRTRRLLNVLLRLVLVTVLALSLLVSTIMFLRANMAGYPGGEAMAVVHEDIAKRIERGELTPPPPPSGGETNNDSGLMLPPLELNVFIDAYAGMSGVTRFLKHHRSDFASNPHSPLSKGKTKKAILSGRKMQLQPIIRYTKDPEIFNKTAFLEKEGQEKKNVDPKSYPTEEAKKFDYLIVREEDAAWHEGQQGSSLFERVTSIGVFDRIVVPRSPSALLNVARRVKDESILIAKRFSFSPLATAAAMLSEIADIAVPVERKPFLVVLRRRS